jgi:hypothetical protein
MTTATAPEPISPLSAVRNRDAVLANLLPKIFGIICSRGRGVHGVGDCTAQLDGDLTVMAGHFGPNSIQVAVYWPVKGRQTKVLSAYVIASPIAGDPDRYRHMSGRVSLMSWRRGRWEDAIMADPAIPRSPSEVFVHGLLRPQNQPFQ